MKKQFFTLFAASVLAAVPASGALAADSIAQEAVPYATNLATPVVATIKQEAGQTQVSIAPEATVKVGPYYFNFNIDGTKKGFESPQFYHTGGSISVTLVQYNYGWGSPNLNWSVITPTYPAITHAPVQNVYGEYDDENITLNFGYVKPGRYSIFIDNLGGTEAVGNYFITYNN